MKPIRLVEIKDIWSHLWFKLYVIWALIIIGGCTWGVIRACVQRAQTLAPVETVSPFDSYLDYEDRLNERNEYLYNDND